MATSTTTKALRADEQPDTDEPARPNGQQAEQTTAQAGAPVGEAAGDTTAAPVAAVGQILRQSQDGALRTARMWTQLFALMNPVALLAAPAEPGEVGDGDDRLGEGAVFPARAVADAGFEMVATVVATQRRNVDEVLATQRRYVDQLLGTQHRPPMVGHPAQILDQHRPPVGQGLHAFAHAAAGTPARAKDLAELRRRRAEVLAAARRRGAHSVRVFGSVARGEATDNSDIDLLVAFDADRSLFDQVHLIDDLEQLLGRRVDVVAEGGLLERDGHILAEAVPL